MPSPDRDSSSVNQAGAGHGGTEPVGAVDSPIGVAIVSWNVSALLERCLATVRSAELGDTARVVVVDNASTDGTPDMVRRGFPDVTLVANRDNVGFSRANNQALAALGVLSAGGEPAGDGPAPPEYVLLLNPDTEVRPDALVLLRDTLAAFPACACVGPALRYADGSRQRSCRRFPSVTVGLLESTPLEWHWPNNPVARRYRMDDLDPGRPATVDWVVGAAMMLRSCALVELGGLDEGFFMYSEELDLCRRLADRGWTTRYEPAAEIVHHEGRSSEQVVPARHLRFMRSRVRYFRKHHGAFAAAVVRVGILKCYIVESCLEAAKWLVGHKRELRAARLRTYLAILRDGLG